MLIAKLRGLIHRFGGAKRPPPSGVETWYSVHWDEENIHRNVAPPGGNAWSDSIEWENIVRVCIECEGPGASDGLYIFTRGREASYAIPVEAQGGSELMGELIRRGLFDAELAIKAALSESGLFCWPAEAPPDGGSK